MDAHERETHAPSRSKPGRGDDMIVLVPSLLDAFVYGVGHADDLAVLIHADVLVVDGVVVF